MRLLIRADASSKIGTGHVMRCLALAQAWQDAGGEVFFATVRDAFRLEERLRSEGIDIEYVTAEPGSIEDAEQTAAIARNIEAGWIVVDGYHFGAEYQRVVKEAGLKLLFIDDNGHANHYYSDIVLNQNFHAAENLYKNRETYVRLLLGSKYVMLRREFLKWQKHRRDIPGKCQKILVTMGGGDSQNISSFVIKALRKLGIAGLEVTVIIGVYYEHIQELKTISERSGFPVRIEVNPDNITELMASADLAITSGGSTCWETAFMGLPSITIVLADNQLLIAEHLDKQGVVRNLGWHVDVSMGDILHSVNLLLDNQTERADMSERGRKLVDGLGCARVIEAM